MIDIDCYIKNALEEKVKYEFESKKLFIEEGEKIFTLAKLDKYGCDNYQDMYSEDEEKRHNLKLVDAFGFIVFKYAKYLSPIIGSISSDVTCYVLYKDEVYEVEKFHSSYIRVKLITVLEDSLKHKLLKFEDILEYANSLKIGKEG